MFLNQKFELDKCFSHLGFLFKRVEPCVSGKVINKDNIILVLINRKNGRSPNICIYVFKRLSRRDRVLIKRKFVTFINEAMRTRQ